MYALYKIDKERLLRRKMSMYEPAVKIDGVNCSIAKQIGYKFDVSGNKIQDGTMLIAFAP